MHVMKFGGTSVANAKRFLQVADLVEKAHKKEQTALVLSAPATITNHLVAMIDKTIGENGAQEHIDAFWNLFTNLLQELQESQPNFSPNISQGILNKEFERIRRQLQGIALLKQCPDNIHAQIVSTGERLSIAIMHELLQSRGDQVFHIDPIKMMLAHGDFLESTVDIRVSSERIAEASIPTKAIILMPGFMAGNQKGELVLLGRNGSDYSAAALAACLRATCCEIWTDVDGVYTCDPRSVYDARLLRHMSYQEAMELSYFGAKVLHPRTIAPLIQFDVPCVIKNTGNPDAPGTSIDGEPPYPDELNIKGITSLSNIAVLNICGPVMVGVSGVSARVFSALTHARIPVLLITQSSADYSLSLCVTHSDLDEALIALNSEFVLELQNKLLDPVTVIRKQAIISAVGDGMCKVEGTAARFFGAFSQSGINIVAIAQGSSERSMSVVVDGEIAVEALRAAHQAMFNTTPIIDIFLIGCGGVGSALLEQIARQQERLSGENIFLRVCGIASSQQMLLDADGIDLSSWQERLAQQTQRFSVDTLRQLVHDRHRLHPVIVDCTSSDEIAKQYVAFMEAGFHIVTPNKKANSSSMETYRQLREVAQKRHRAFFYEATVGAGLPVVNTLQDLLRAGDELHRFHGVLSGSLSFIFGKLEEGYTLSQATILAREKGFTEPDPRDDLSGMDVARKLLILARECSCQLELSDVTIDPILPESFKEGDVANFMQRLPELDAPFQQRVDAARAAGKVLRLAGQISHGKCHVGIVEVGEDDPLFKIKDGENALAFYSDYYQPIPLVLRGYGAGNQVTAAGIFGDILRMRNSRI